MLAGLSSLSTNANKSLIKTKFVSLIGGFGGVFKVLKESEEKGEF